MAALDLRPDARRSGGIRLERVHYDEYRSLRRFGGVDGLRAISILLVLTWHVNSKLLAWLSGWEGVTIFFVLSGYLITTLCIREHDESGRLSLRGFYLRRSCRIFPLYFIVLAVYVGYSLVLGLGDHGDQLRAALPYYVSYTNEWAPSLGTAPYGQSWSLGIEEKFYLVWPVLAFVLLGRRGGRRAAVATAVALLPIVLTPWAFESVHATPYGSIMIGCLLALALHDRRGYG